jgi:hypothetical protein
MVSSRLTLMADPEHAITTAILTDLSISLAKVAVRNIHAHHLLPLPMVRRARGDARRSLRLRWTRFKKAPCATLPAAARG